MPWFSGGFAVAILMGVARGNFFVNAENEVHSSDGVLAEAFFSPFTIAPHAHRGRRHHRWRHCRVEHCLSSGSQGCKKFL